MTHEQTSQQFGSIVGPKPERTSMTATNGDSAKAMIPLGEVRLRDLSVHLSDLPADAKGILLAAPWDTPLLRYAGRLAKSFQYVKGVLQKPLPEKERLLSLILQANIDSFRKDAAFIRKIDEKHGLHFEGHILTGMQISDLAPKNNKKTYEMSFAEHIRLADQEAAETGKMAITGLAIGTLPMVYGRMYGRTMDASIVPGLAIQTHNRDHILGNPAELTANGLQGTVIDRKFGITAVGETNRSVWHFTCTEHSTNPTMVTIVDMCANQDYGTSYTQKSKASYASRPMAVAILPR